MGVLFSVIFIHSAVFLLFSPVYTQEIDESTLFGDTTLTIIDSAKLSASAVSLPGTDSTVASFSGSVSAITEPAVTRDWFCKPEKNDVTLSALMLGDIMLDVRLPFGFKAYADAEAIHNPGFGSTTFSVPEFFLDINYAQRIYFRAGKQVLQWGRGNFWNPTDMVNVEKKTFIEKIGARVGTFGLKTHIPFGTRCNIYGFIDMNNTGSVDSLAGAARLEGLFGGTEAGIALWSKPYRDPIFGFDFSSSVGKWSIFGEMSLTSGNNYRVFDLDKTLSSMQDNHANGIPSFFFTPDEDVVVRACAGFMRSIDFLDVDDRIMIIGEFYYNQIGDDGNVFEKYHLGSFIKEIQNNATTLPASMQNQPMALFANAFEFNSLARYYAALFASMRKFIIPDMTLQCNGLVNVNHGCAILTTGVQYVTLHDFSLGILLTGYVGPEESEYTLLGNGASVRVTAGVLF